MHIFGRAKAATQQKYGEAVQLPRKDTGFYEGFKPLDEEDMISIKSKIQSLMRTEKYRSSNLLNT